MDNLDLSHFFQTKAQARDFLERIATINKHIYENDFDLETCLAEQLGLSKKEQFLRLLRERGVTVEKPQAIQSFLTGLEKQVLTFPVLSISLAFEPTGETLRLLTDWFLLNIKRQVILDIAVEPSLIAGVAFRYNGRYLDYSIKDAFLQVLVATLSQAEQQTPGQPAHHPQLSH